MSFNSPTARSGSDSCERYIYSAGIRRFDRRWLERCSVWTGRVQQVFSQAAVVEPDGPDHRLTVVEASQGLVPYGLCLNSDSARLAVGQQLILEGRFLSVISADSKPHKSTLLGSGVSLCLPNASDRGSLAALHQQVSWLERFRKHQEGLTGVDSRVAGLLEQSLSALVEMLFAERPDADFSDLIHGLAGLGFGSTPSGDDLLVGVAACCTRFSGLGWFPELELEGLRQALRGLSPARTTRVGYEMIVQSSEGAFVETLIDLVGGLGCPKTERRQVLEAGRALCRVGGHSGVDMLSGVLAVAKRRLASHREVFER